MEAASRDHVRVVPPRTVPPAIPPRVNVPNRRSPREDPSSRENRRSVDITCQNTNADHERRKRDTPTKGVQASAGNDVHSCSLHEFSPCCYVCTNCVELLCEHCVEPENHKHKDCSLSYVGNGLESMCDQVKSSLSRKMNATEHCVGELSRSLSRKKSRMIAKKDETLTEIDRFYQRLKAKLLAKLQREENELVTYLQTTVAEQESSLTEKLQQCSKIVHGLQQKGAMLDNLDKLHSATDNISAYLKSLFSTAVDVNKDKESIDEITAARDAFLVIRFIVNAESEQVMINTKVASVEVLDSRSSSPDRDNLEAEHINEALSNTGAESSGSIDSIQTIDNCEQSETSSAADHRVANGEPGTNDATSSDQLVETSNNNSRSSQAVPNSAGSVHNSDRERSPHNSETSSANEDEEDSDDDLPPPYPGPPIIFQPHEIPDENPPPYPGPPPPLYVQLPEPQQPQNPVQLQPSNMPPLRRQRYGGVSEDNLSPTRPYPTSPRQAPVSVLLPVALTPPASTFPSVTRPRGPLKTFSVNEISDKRLSGIFSVAVFSSKYFLIVDRWNRKLKFFNDQGQSLGGLIFLEEPWDIAKVSNELFAVTVPKLQVICKVKASAQSVTTVGNVVTMKKYACIAFHETSQRFICGQVPQFGEPSVDVISLTGGPILLSFRADQLGRDLFSYPRYVKVANDGTVVVCDWNLKSLLIFKLDGTVVGRYKGCQDFLLNEPMGIELDTDTNKLYVIDAKQTSADGTVQKVSLDCQCEEVYRGHDDFRDARAVTIYENQRMAVGSKNGILSIFSTRARYR